MTATASKKVCCQDRTYATVLKRVEHILEAQKTRSQLYKDEDFKVFWKPDHESVKCHDCEVKFNYFRRKHHCRICGQIFCSSCCDKIIPGKHLGCIDALKSCTFCCKILLNQLTWNTVGDDMLKELKILQKHLIPDHIPPSIDSVGRILESGSQEGSFKSSKRRMGFVEENIDARSIKHTERDQYFSDSHQLKYLWYVMTSGPNKVSLANHRWRLKVYSDSFDGREFIKWLRNENMASNMENAISIGQSLLNEGYIYNAAGESNNFTNEYCIYKIGSAENIEQQPTAIADDRTQEPSWIKSIPSQSADGGIDDSSAEFASPVKENLIHYSTAMTNSSYSLDLNLEENVVSISRSSTEILDVKDERFGAVTADVNSSTLTTISASNQFASYSMKNDKGLEVLKDFNPIQAEAAAMDWQRKFEITELDGITNENISKNRIIKARLFAMWKAHESSLFKQLLEINCLSESWGDIILPIAYKIISTVCPDVRHEGDLMDIRQYVNFKKVPGGQMKDCEIVNGTVCTKNVVRTDMKTSVPDPQILLISPAIDPIAQMNLGALTANDSSMLEAEYTRRILPKLLSCKPNIIICENRVMFSALEQFLEANVTVVMNMKNSVMQRVSRCTTARIVNCIDSEMQVIPQFSSEKESPLGMCHSFYLRSYKIPQAQTQKTLMFFDGCATHLGCTIILRGGSNAELTRVKSVLRFIVYALHNWKLEQSFLMDELIYLPSSLRGNRDVKGFLQVEEPDQYVSEEIGNGNNVSKEFELVEAINPKKFVPANGDPVFDKKDKFGISTPQKDLKLINHPIQDSESKIIKPVEDCSDPLQCYLKDNSVSPHGSRKTSLSIMTTRDTNFHKALEKTVLSVSPLVLNQLPFLESSVGKLCTTRMFFPENLYYSFILQPGRKRKYSDNDIENNSVKSANVEFREPHPFVTTPIVDIIKGPIVRSGIADYRARGCRIKTICKCDKNKFRPSKLSTSKTVQTVKHHYNDTILMPEGMVDAFHLYNHQQLAMHHFIFAQSNKDTQLCIQPRLMNINFYGIKDYPLGDYLEKYCFDVTHKCRSCKRELMDLGNSRNRIIHVMKFIHGKGSVEIVLKKLDNPVVEISHSVSTIYMWTSCQICNQNSAVVPMATETWMFSFGKFMELLFYDNRTTRRDETACLHSLHQDHAHYFAQKNVVAVIKYSPISVKNLFIPPPEIEYMHVAPPKLKLVEEIKLISLEGHSIIERILSQLEQLLAENFEEGYLTYVESLVQHYKILNNSFKSEVGKIQLQMTSKSYINFSVDPFVNQELAPTLYDVLDQLIFIKRMIFRIIQDWNERVQDLCQKKKDAQKVIDKLKSPSFLDSKKNKTASQDIDKSAVTASEISSVKNENLSTESSISAEEKRKTMIRSSSNPEASNIIIVSSENKKSLNTDEANMASSEAHKVSLSSSSGSCYTDSIELAEESREDTARKKRMCTSSEAVMSDYIRPGPKQFRCFKRETEEVSEKEKPSYSHSFKAIFTNLLGSSDIEIIKYPFHPSEHYNLLPEVSVPVVIYDDEPSSIIAKALASQEYQKHLKTILHQRSTSRSQSSWGSPKSMHVSSTPINCGESPNHIALQWNDSSANYYCKIFFADRFHDLRELVFPTGEEAFIRSLSRCANWEAKGGKSGSLFCKTTDDRFVLKEVSDKEMASMDTFAPSFIQYLIDSKKHNQPTVFARIIGIFRIAFKNTDTDKVLRRDLLVMENLFYQRNISHKYDLKGTLRNREAKIEELEETEVVLLDKNLLKMTCSSQFYLRPQGKSILTRAIDSDTDFLKKHEIMDYSLVVGFDEEKNELVVGIVDYIRPFTFDKKMEFAIKQIFLYPSNTNEKPTIVSPENYRKRFCEAMEKYFAFTPDKWVGLASPTLDLI